MFLIFPDTLNENRINGGIKVTLQLFCLLYDKENIAETFSVFNGRCL